MHLTIDDNGVGPGTGYREGHGIVGMRERAALVGGSVTVGRSPAGGWRVDAHLPRRAGACRCGRRRMSIRVLLVDDQAIVRSGLKLALSDVDGITVVGEAADGREAVVQAEVTRPDVVVMDVRMPASTGSAPPRACSPPCPG